MSKTTPFVLINDFLIDCAVSESFSYASEVTEYPVEKGADLTDNIRPKPVEVTVEGLVSNTPIGTVATIRDASSSAEGTAVNTSTGVPVDDAFAMLESIRNAREPVKISTSLKDYPSMAMADLTIERTAATGNALKFSAKFVEVIIASNTLRVRPPTAAPGGQKNKTVNAPPKPISNTGYYKVILVKNFAGHEDWYWRDEDIGGWRKGAHLGIVGVAGDTTTETDFWGQKYKPTTGIDLTAFTQNALHGVINYLVKGIVFGASPQEFSDHGDDKYWQAKIAAVVATPQNVFDPWGAFGNTVEWFYDRVLAQRR